MLNNKQASCISHGTKTYPHHTQWMTVSLRVAVLNITIRLFNSKGTKTMSKKHILILGCGYVGKKMSQTCLNNGMQVSACTRSAQHAKELQAIGISPILAQSPADIPSKLCQSITHLLDSIPLTRQDTHMFASQDSFIPRIEPKLQSLQWAGYLSTTGVYGDTKGAWVNEESRCQPQSERGKHRLLAEKAWLQSTLPVEIFRLAGIYGHDRNIISRLMTGNYKAISWQPEHFSSRIHVDDIISTLLAAIAKPHVGRILNIADDLPLPHSQYVQKVAAMTGAPAPIILTPDEGKEQLSATALSFFSDNKRISNQKLHDELMPTLQYPSFIHGIQSIMQSTLRPSI